MELKVTANHIFAIKKVKLAQALWIYLINTITIFTIYKNKILVLCDRKSCKNRIIELIEVALEKFQRRSLQNHDQYAIITSRVQ